MKIIVLLSALLYLISCSEGNPQDPFEGNVYYTASVKTAKYISTDSILYLPNSVYTDTAQQQIAKLDRYSDKETLDLLDSSTITTLETINSTISRIPLYSYYNKTFLYISKIYTSLDIVRKVVNLVDDGTLPLNSSELRNGGLLVTTITSADETSKQISVLNPIDSSINISVIERNTANRYYAEYNCSDSLFTATNVKMYGRNSIDTLDLHGSTIYGNISMFITKNVNDSDIAYHFTVKAPVNLVEDNVIGNIILPNDSIFIKGICFNGGTSLIKIFFNDTATPFLEIVKQSNLSLLKDQLSSDTLSSKAFFWSLENSKAIDTSFFSNKYSAQSDKIASITFEDLEKFLDLNYYNIATKQTPYLSNFLHLYFIKENLFYIDKEGTFTYYGDYVPAKLATYISYQNKI